MAHRAWVFIDGFLALVGAVVRCGLALGFLAFAVTIDADHSVDFGMLILALPTGMAWATTSSGVGATTAASACETPKMASIAVAMLKKVMRKVRDEFMLLKTT